MSALAAALEDYLALRRSLGYKLERAAEVLAEFVAHLDEASAEHITVDLGVDWAMRAANPDSSWRAQRLGMVRCFARYLHALDPGHADSTVGAAAPGPAAGTVPVQCCRHRRADDGGGIDALAAAGAHHGNSHRAARGDRAAGG